MTESMAYLLANYVCDGARLDLRVLRASFIRGSLASSNWPRSSLQAGEGEFGKPVYSGGREVGLLVIRGPVRELDRLREDSLEVLSVLVSYLEARPRGSSLPAIQLGRILHEARVLTGLTRSTLASRLGIKWDILESWEEGHLGPSWDQVLAWCAALGIVSSPSVPLVTVVSGLAPQLLQMIKVDPNRLRRLTAEQFEHFVADRLDHMGFEVTLTGNVNRKDGGVDLIAVPKAAGAGTFLLAGQCKHHSGDDNTGVDAVDRLLSLRHGLFGAGLLVTNTQFTTDARWRSVQGTNSAFVKLRDFEDIRRWLQNNFHDAAEFRELPEYIDLAPGVRIAVPRPVGRPRS
jgi:DNA-binding XRE family transcriptional regulator